MERFTERWSVCSEEPSAPIVSDMDYMDPVTPSQLIDVDRTQFTALETCT
jgi:hypothetical protein